MAQQLIFWKEILSIWISENKKVKKKRYEKPLKLTLHPALQLQNILKFQIVPYKLRPVPFLQTFFLYTIQSMVKSEKTLYQMSYKLEPKT